MGPRSGFSMTRFIPTAIVNSRRTITLLLFTDGLYEVEGPGGDIYDYRRLLEAVSRRRELPAFQLCHEIIEEVQRFSAGRHFSDDVCLVAMEVGPMSM